MRAPKPESLAERLRTAADWPDEPDFVMTRVKRAEWRELKARARANGRSAAAEHHRALRWYLDHSIEETLVQETPLEP